MRETRTPRPRAARSAAVLVQLGAQNSSLLQKEGSPSDWRRSSMLALLVAVAALCATGEAGTTAGILTNTNSLDTSECYDPDASWGYCGAPT